MEGQGQVNVICELKRKIKSKALVCDDSPGKIGPSRIQERECDGLDLIPMWASPSNHLAVSSDTVLVVFFCVHLLNQACFQKDNRIMAFDVKVKW